MNERIRQHLKQCAEKDKFNISTDCDIYNYICYENDFEIVQKDHIRDDEYTQYWRYVRNFNGVYIEYRAYTGDNAPDVSWIIKDEIPAINEVIPVEVTKTEYVSVKDHKDTAQPNEGN